MGSLIVGTEFAKSLGVSLEIPVIDVNHMQAHILANFINNGDPNPEFPFLGVTISGGHTQFILVEDYFKMNVIGETLDDAIGEAFDKCGKKIGLDYPAGPEIDKLSRMGDELKFNFPIPRVEGGNISYSGTKTAFINFLQNNLNRNNNFIDEYKYDICASIQKNLIDNLLGTVDFFIKDKNLKRIVFGGGVSANTYLKKRLNKKSKESGLEIFIPEIQYTTDNAAMIGIVGYFKYLNSELSDLRSTPLPRYNF